MTMRSIFLFLGGIRFALLLIAATASFAIAGTFLEAASDSHRYASLFTYGSPLFSLLLWGFFLNILISALRRYPFKLRHLPFLITHFGMLMILAGTLVKTHFGTQGTMTILEGSSSDEIFFSDSYALYVEAKNSTSPQYYLFNSQFPRYSQVVPYNSEVPFPYDQLSITLLDYATNSTEKIDSWVKWGHTSIFGMKPQPIHPFDLAQGRFPHPTQVQLPGRNETWEMLALNVDDASVVTNFANEELSQMNGDDSMARLLIMRDSEEESHILVKPYGSKSYVNIEQLGSSEKILAYDDGHLGYTVELEFPIPSSAPLTLETPLVARHKIIPTSTKLENNTPCIALRFKIGAKEEILTLGYNLSASGFKWPILNGEFIVRFQPLFTKIPYSLRLRQARQINYAESNQPFSYESDLIINQKQNGNSSEHSISMNNVYETWDGYRFYLANISPSEKGALKRIQVVVNRDPAKYWLTYPGALLMMFGILLLFFPWRKRQ